MKLAVTTNTDLYELASTLFNALDVRDNTRREYCSRIRKLLTFIELNGFSANTLLDFKRMLDANEWYSVSTKNKYLACAKIFLRECHRTGLLPRDITGNIKSFQQNKKHRVDGLTDNEVKRVCEVMAIGQCGIRSSLIIHLLLFQGLRQVEVCNIQLKDIEPGCKAIWIKGKGRDDKERVVLHPRVVRLLTAYKTQLAYDNFSLKTFVAARLNRSQYLFTSRRGNTPNQKLTPRGLQHIVKKVFTQASIDKNVHGFRHYFTTTLIREMPSELMTVARFTRHKSLEMLTVYNDSLTAEADIERCHQAFGGVETMFVKAEANHKLHL